MITSTNVNRNGLIWTTTANGAYNASRVVDLYGDGNDDPANGWFIGRPIRTIYDLKYGGIFRTADEVASSPQITSKPGYVRVVDVNGDGAINAADRTFQGNLDPRYTYGLTNTVSYKGLSLMVFIQGVASITKENRWSRTGCSPMYAGTRPKRLVDPPTTPTPATGPTTTTRTCLVFAFIRMPVLPA